MRLREYIFCAVATVYCAAVLYLAVVLPHAGRKRVSAQHACTRGASRIVVVRSEARASESVGHDNYPGSFISSQRYLVCLRLTFLLLGGKQTDMPVAAVCACSTPLIV